MGRYFNDFINDQNLSHHGILGMSWGKKNGPPYPLDGSDHSAAEKKAGWRKSLGGGSGESKSEKKSKKQKKIEAARTLREIEKNRSNEEDESTRKWDNIYNEIEKAYFDYNSKKFHMDRAVEAESGDRLKIRSKYRDQINNYLIDEGLSKKKLSDKEIEKLSKKIYKYADKQIDKDRAKNAKKLEENTDRYNKLKTTQNEASKIISDNSSKISKDVAKELYNDLVRWNGDGSDKTLSTAFKGKNKDQIMKYIEKQVKNNIDASSTDTFKDGTINFNINGIKEYSDYAPLTVDYDPKNKSIKGLYYL